MPMDEFDSASSEESDSQEGDEQTNLWMCGASQATMLTDGSKWRKEVENDNFIPAPYPEEKFEPVEWSHCLVAIDVCTLNHGTKFCDEEGYDIVPIQMVAIVNDDRVESKPLEKERFHREEVSVEDLPLVESADDELCSDDDDSDDDFIVPESELEKVRMLLKGREGVEVEIPCDKPKRKFCKSHKKFRRQEV